MVTRRRSRADHGRTPRKCASHGTGAQTIASDRNRSKRKHPAKTGSCSSAIVAFIRIGSGRPRSFVTTLLNHTGSPAPAGLPGFCCRAIKPALGRACETSTAGLCKLLPNEGGTHYIRGKPSYPPARGIGQTRLELADSSGSRISSADHAVSASLVEGIGGPSCPSAQATRSFHRYSGRLPNRLYGGPPPRDARVASVARATG